MEFTKDQPIYLQIVDHFCENILTGKWKEKERIPAVREVAVSLEVNPNTAMRAYELLQTREVIFNKRGIGYFVNTGGYNKVLEWKRKEFLEQVAPQFLKQMDILKIDFEELKKIQTNQSSKEK